MLPARQGRGYMAHNSYTMCIHSLPDMYTLRPHRASGLHIRQTTHAHGITVHKTFHARMFSHPEVLFLVSLLFD